MSLADFDTREEGRGTLGLALLCGFALLTVQVRTWLLNHGVFPTVVGTFGLARDLQTMVGPIVGLVLIMLAFKRPKYLLIRPAIFAACLSAAIGSALLILFSTHPSAVVPGIVLLAFSNVWSYYFVGLGLAQIDDVRVMASTIVCGLLVGRLFETFCAVPGYVVSVLAVAVTPFLCYGLLWRCVIPIVERISSGSSVQDMAVASPRSYVAPFHQFYVLIAIFAAAAGFGVGIHEQDATPVNTVVPMVLLSVMGVWFLISKRQTGNEDVLAVFAGLFIVAGLLCVLSGPPVPAYLANGLIAGGGACFRVLPYLALAVLCRRNPPGSIYVLACGSIAQNLGVIAGSALGHACGELSANQPGLTSLVIIVLVIGMFAYALLGLRNFSFRSTFSEVEEAREVEPPASMQAPNREELFENSCAALARECGATERESETLRLLARGYSGKRIQEELTVSHNTVKSYANRLYRKLDIHSQQELINLVESRMGESVI